MPVSTIVGITKKLSNEQKLPLSKRGGVFLTTLKSYKNLLRSFYPLLKSKAQE